VGTAGVRSVLREGLGGQAVQSAGLVFLMLFSFARKSSMYLVLVGRLGTSEKVRSCMALGIGRKYAKKDNTTKLHKK